VTDSIDRRRFLGTSAGAAAWLAAAGGLRAAGPGPTEAAATEPPPAPPTVELGGTGIKASRLAMGTGTGGGNRQSSQTRLGFAKLGGLMRHAHERGITFFDMADLYGSHVYFREALRSVPRETLTVLTKVWWRYDGPADQTNRPERGQIVRSTIERFRNEIGTDYLDIVLLHCLMQPNWEQPMQPYLDALQEEKQQGHIRAVGCSCHDFGALKTAAASPWVDVILARINPQGVAMDAGPDEVVPVLRTAKKNGKAVIGMKIFGEGRLADRREECVKYAQELGCLDAMTIGLRATSEIDDVLRLMHQYPAKA
jgi:aryl-alcohol dehydrogenase-like predicted oxidoreductase